MSVRAKFFIIALEPFYPRSDGQPTGGTVKLRPVYSQDPSHENKAFWDATPSGLIEMSINNPTAFDFFAKRMGKEFYIDFAEAS